MLNSAQKGTPAVEIRDIEANIEGILFASGEPVSINRIASVLEVEPEIIKDAAQRISDSYSFNRRGIRLIFLDEAIQLVSSPECAEFIRKTLETRKAPQLTQTALEVLAIIAYFQPATRAYVEQVRGADSSYTVGVLQERGLIEPCGRLQVPGRPVLFRTTKAFLRTFGISSLSELPEIPELDENSEKQLQLKSAIEALRQASEPEPEQTEVPEQT